MEIPGGVLTEAQGDNGEKLYNAILRFCQDHFDFGEEKIFSCEDSCILVSFFFVRNFVSPFSLFKSLLCQKNCIFLINTPPKIIHIFGHLDPQIYTHQRTFSLNDLAWLLNCIENRDSSVGAPTRRAA